VPSGKKSLTRVPSQIELAMRSRVADAELEEFADYEICSQRNHWRSMTKSLNFLRGPLELLRTAFISSQAKEWL